MIFNSLQSAPMSLQVNLSSREISDAYQNVVAGRDIDWVLYTYDKGGNDLKVQATGNGGLDELEEEFSDGRYGYIVSSPLPFLTYVQNPVRICTCHRS